MKTATRESPCKCKSCSDWTPSIKNINSLPEPIRRFIRNVETKFDPTRLVRENMLLKDQVQQLLEKNEELKNVLESSLSDQY